MSESCMLHGAREGLLSYLPSSPKAESVSSSSHLYTGESQHISTHKLSIYEDSASYKWDLCIGRNIVHMRMLLGIVLRLGSLGRRSALRLVRCFRARHGAGWDLDAGI